MTPANTDQTLFFAHFDVERPLRKLNSAGVCFGAKDDQFGRFEAQVGGSIDAVKLVQLTGLVNSGGGIDKSTKWGFDPDLKVIAVVITST